MTTAQAMGDYNTKCYAVALGLAEDAGLGAVMDEIRSRREKGKHIPDQQEAFAAYDAKRRK